MNIMDPSQSPPISLSSLVLGFSVLFLIAFVPIFILMQFFARKWHLKKKIILSAVLSVLSIFIFLAFQAYRMKDVVY